MQEDLALEECLLNGREDYRFEEPGKEQLNKRKASLWNR